jgi:uncharacterized protein
MSVEEVRERAKSYFGGVAPAHDWNHVKRVYSIAEKLADEEGADPEVVRLAVLLHDIGRKKEDDGEIDDHAEWGAEKAVEILKELECREETVEEVRHCIEAHRYSTDPEPETLEAKVVSDADNMDALGASGVARTFTYAGEHGSMIADPEIPVEEDDSEEGQTALNHLQKKILSLKERMYTDSGRQMAEERHDYVEEFVDRFKREIHGEI